MIYHQQDAAFREWQVQNPNGFYINRKGGSAQHVVHKADCLHVPKADANKRGDLSVTRTAKEVFNNKGILWHHLKQLKEQPKLCKTCNPL